MKTLKELDEMRYAYRKKARLQKYKNINSQMAFRNKNNKSASPRKMEAKPERKLPVATETVDNCYKACSVYFTQEDYVRH